jgi:hypothetical protein
MRSDRIGRRFVDLPIGVLEARVEAEFAFGMRARGGMTVER